MKISYCVLKNIILNLGTMWKYIMESGQCMYVFASNRWWTITVVYPTDLVLVKIVIMESGPDFELCYVSH
jgi:hypothetical protein